MVGLHFRPVGNMISINGLRVSALFFKRRGGDGWAL